MFKNLQKFAKNKGLKFFLALGIVLLLCGTILHYIFPFFLGFVMNLIYKIKDGNFIFDIWREIPIPINTKVYVFNITNAEEFKNGAKPIVKELGPYVYKQYRVREVIQWSDDKQIVKFYETLQFIYDPIESFGSLNDKITVVNIPILIAFSIINLIVERFPFTSVITPIVNNVVNVVLNIYNEGIIETRTASEIISGRRISLLDTLDIFAKPLRTLGLPIPEYAIASYKLVDNSYGFLAIRNNSKFGPFEVYTGIGSEDKFMKYSTFLDKESLGLYRDQSCDAINGTDGAMFGPFLDKTKPLYIYNQHACRSLRIEFSGETDVNGVKAYRFSFADNMFDGPNQYSDNWCFCPQNSDPDQCDGILDLSQCLTGVPFALSFPHFLNYPQLMAEVSGLNPDRDKHLGYFDLEPTLGITLRGSGRFQINLRLKPFDFVPGLNNFKPTLLPYLWIDEGALVDGWLGLLLKTGSYAINGSNYAFILTILIGFITFLVSFVLILKKRSENNRVLLQPLPKPNENYYHNNNNGDLSILSVLDLRDKKP